MVDNMCIPKDQVVGIEFPGPSGKKNHHLVQNTSLSITAMSVSTILCMLAYYLLHGWKRLFKGKVISYDPTCSHKQCDSIVAITTVPTLYIPS